jgi:hypothetical protein
MVTQLHLLMVMFMTVRHNLCRASVLATHTASGTRYTATTDIDGNFRISNMRVGGPYQIIVSYVGFVSYDVNNVYLQLGTL